MQGGGGAFVGIALILYNDGKVQFKSYDQEEKKDNGQFCVLKTGKHCLRLMLDGVSEMGRAASTYILSL